MTQRALICAVDDYPPPADKLDAAVKEGRYWAELFRNQYQFGAQNVVTMFDREAVRIDVLNALRDLLRQTQDDDHVVFVCCGHGGPAQSWISDDRTGDQKEVAFIAYVPNGRNGFQQAAITPSDLIRLLTEIPLPQGARFTMIAEFCHSARFVTGNEAITPAALPEVSPKILFIPNAVPELPIGPAGTFADVESMLAGQARSLDRRRVSFVTPLLLAASREDQPAQEVGDPGNRRCLFSKRAIQRLQQAVAARSPISSAVLISEINPLSQRQSAMCVPAHGQADEDFAGGFSIQESGVPALEAAGVATAKTTRQTVRHSESIDVRIYGLGTLINLPIGPYRNRFVFPRDTYAKTKEEAHRGFVEVADQDMTEQPGGVPPTLVYYRSGVKYSRWILTEHIVRIANGSDNGAPLYRTGDFERYVPSMLDVNPGLPCDPRVESTYYFVIPEYFSGFFDVRSGSIDIGELEEEKTEFRRQYSHELTRRAEYTPISVLMNVPLEESYAVVVVEGPWNTYSAIFVKSGSAISVGNAREEDIVGPGSGEGRPEQFLIYYNLAPRKPCDPGLPQIMQVPINACTVTTWP